MPLTSNPDAFYLSNDDFFDRFGFEKPRSPKSTPSSSPSPSTASSESPYSPKMKEREANSGLNFDNDSKFDSMQGNNEVAGGGEGEGEGEGVEEVVFYCKAGVRSRAAARMAREWAGIRVGDMKGGWMEWEGKGGAIER